MKHFEIVSNITGNPVSEISFATYDEALTFLVEDPLLSADANHPFYWGRRFEIVLCGGDGCEISAP